MGTIRKPSISPPPPSPSPYESVISRTRIIYNRNITEKSFRAKTSSLSLSNKTKTLLGGGARAFFFLLHQTCGPRKMGPPESRNSWRGGGDYYFFGRNRDFIRKVTIVIQSLLQFAEFYSRGERGEEGWWRETRVFLAQGNENFAMGGTRIRIFYVCHRLKAMHANEWNGGGIGSIRGKE